MMQTAQAPTNDMRLTFHFAPAITHDSIERMSPAQKDQALHEFIDLRNVTRSHIFTPSASPQTRIVALATIYDRAQKTAVRRPDGSRVLESVTQQMPIWIGDKDKEGSYSARIGISRNALSNEFSALEKAGLMSRFYRDTEDSYNQHLDTAITPDLLTHPELLPGKGERTRRPPVICKECGSMDLRRKTKLVCADCGTVHSESETLVNQEEEEEQSLEHEIVNPSTPPDVAVSEAEQTQQPLCTREVHSVIGIEDCTREVHNVEHDAAQLLLEIAGPGIPKSEHIEMNTNPELERKYTTIPRLLHLGDMLDHLGGLKTKGATLQHPFHMTRALCFDADTPEDWQRLEEAARMLAVVDFQAILERSPVPDGGEHAGGGHLWIVFTTVVDCYSALQTVYRYVPMLKEITEYWPREGNHRVRLPGGKYVKPGYAAWCTLYDAYGSELSHDGAGAALALLEHQTPAQVVIACQKPAPEIQFQHEQSSPPTAAGVLGNTDDRAIMAAINASFSWAELAALCGGFNREKKFRAIWRDEQVPSVSINPRTDLAKDFGRPDEPAMDKYDVWCHIKGGADWKAFKRADLDERCKQMRCVQERRAS